MLTSNRTDACMLGLLLGYHNSTIKLLYTDNIPGPIVFPFCCWAGLKSVSLPKMKPHSGLFTSVGEYLLLQLWTVAVSFLFGESSLVSTTTYNVWSLWAPSVTCWISIVSHMVPFSEMAVAIECLHLAVAEMNVFTWGQSGSTHGRGIGRSSRHRQVVIHVFYLENTGILFIYGMI